ncbi:MAG: DEAD/DEAH box helicase [Candidatus Heimdallarchaeota archaeon]|nr:DEAD/DEAH box helicase [Candidatus Heimdallarchaeota archaeon]
MKFQDYNLKQEIKQALDEMGIDTPTEIQEKAIPQILEGEKSHILAQAKTGTGKTLAFAIPLAEQLDPSSRNVQAVIMVPTRELCKQVYHVISDVTKYRHLKAVEVYGGVSIDRQIKNIRSGAQIIIATPGRLIDLYHRRAVNFKQVKFVVLDEADRMLDMGFLPDIDFILFDAMKDVFPRLLLFSATLLEEIKEIASDFSWGQELIEIDVSKDDITVASCTQYYYEIDDPQKKYNAFIRILLKERPQSCIIFVNTKRWAAMLKKRLINDKRIELRIDTLQGDMTQMQREMVMSDFRKKKITCLIATDVAARGLDIPHVSHIFNYDLPVGNAENYVHRIGRTSRMQRIGKAISIVETEQMNMIRRIESFMNKDILRYYLTEDERKNDHGRSTYPQRKTTEQVTYKKDEKEDDDDPYLADLSRY